MRGLAVMLLAAPMLLAAQQQPIDSLAVEAAIGATRYADRRAAAADGYRRIGPDFPGMGEHWLNTAMLLSGKIDAKRPTILIYANIAGAPTLLGAGFVTTTLGDERASVPGWPDKWHEHSGLLVDESGVAPSARAQRGTHVWVLHAWTNLANPAGQFTPDNWALPFVRAQLDLPAHADADVARALSMLNGGDVYLRDVLTDANMRTPARASSVDSVLVSTRVRVAALVNARRPARSLSDDELSRLRGEWVSMSQSLRALLGPDVDQYLAPPHASHHTAEKLP